MTKIFLDENESITLKFKRKKKKKEPVIGAYLFGIWVTKRQLNSYLLDSVGIYKLLQLIDSSFLLSMLRVFAVNFSLFMSLVESQNH